MNQITSEKSLSAEQVDFVLCDVATTAKQIDRLVALLVAGCDELDSEAFLISIACLAQRIGWAADMAMAGSKRSTGPFIGDAVDWMMPPTFHEQGAQSQSAGRD